ncbi:hypothetical protein I3760_05G236200 [Carya illinoinensis]|uniref:Metallo-beta-lactamase domain-containing protein n=1 Tax=Carya illinoinensis TaxID=32201 RepID=A0A922F6F0_CARIL|nr:uncharacterized protein LOC122309905 isoform X2 [Carya illinoinensis]KAG2709391.1 hypothetical protein I3760_05G236200 [Carya illinoinensis]KAG2709392.1 hypothetical protein I3760_05G236200 [Carya illinoinensis]KAG6715092.1 hypothetical protein I3842_05G232900 [Carya illinoinensis]KAG6715093.1 hypothetical protein I3842_05G232900 [Carya illinoinensis]
MAAIHNLAVILKNPLNHAEFLLVKQTRPNRFGDEEYDSFVDSELWDLPSTRLNLLEGESESQIVVVGAESCSEKINLRKLDIDSALDRVLDQVGLAATDGGEWKFWKYVEEPEFGPGFPVHNVFITGQLVAGKNLQELCKWMSVETCLSWLLEVKPSSNRMGPLVVVGLINDSMQPADQIVPPILRYQEYPPGVKVIPIGSKTAKPFHTTNLIVFAPENVSNENEKNSFVASGDALIVDPGCRSEFHKELQKIVAALPRKIIVFVTHHHRDHVEGLSIIQKCNPDATLLTHENTMRRIGKGDWSLGYTSVSGAEDICIGGQRLRVIFAPGHTDGHMALLHVSTNSLIVGDHCVGQGSSLLDFRSGGNMSQYFQTTYKFLELSPHALIPMHGRVNLWPKHMLCGYLKNRRSRETSILKAIENGAETLFDIVSDVYSDVDRSAWIAAASNVRLHVDYLAQQDKLPEGFSLETFDGSFSSFAEKVGKLEPK